MRSTLVLCGLAVLLVVGLTVPGLFASDPHASAASHGGGEGGAAHDKDKGHAPIYEIIYNKDGHEVEKTLDLRKPEDMKEFLAAVNAAEHGHLDHLRLTSKPPDLLALRWDLALWTLVIFGLTLFILSRVAWGPMLEGLRNRETTIRKALDDAQIAKDEAQKLRAELQQERANAQHQVQLMFDKAHKEAEQAAEEIRSKAKADIAAERDRLMRELEMARSQALNELVNRSAQLATLISSKVLHREMNEADHARLVNDALAELDRNLRNGHTGNA
jgi:F-type H+-transporting ATPase subunit b